LQFTVAHALGFSVFTSLISATDFIAASLSLQITHDVFFSQPNSFLAMILDLIQFPCSQAHITAGWRLKLDSPFLDYCSVCSVSSRVLCYERRSGGQSVLVSSPTWGLRPDFYYCQTVTGLLMWGALSNERTGLSFTIVVGPCQYCHFRVRVPRDSRTYFIISYLRLPFLSLSTIRRATAEVFDPASTRDCFLYAAEHFFTTNLHRPRRKHSLYC
jgi:hypothetical protein